MTARSLAEQALELAGKAEKTTDSLVREIAEHKLREFARSALPALAERVLVLEAALREIVELRLDTTPGVTLTEAVAQARRAMREIAIAALADDEKL